ncbi:MAG: chromate transporter, partial [Christensenellales bacterium]
MKRATGSGAVFQFMKFGLFTFGGGWSIIAQMQKLYVEQEHTITSEELLDLTSVGRSLPGTMIGNVAMLYGYRVAGIAGGMACLFGMILPPMAVLAVITQFYTAFQSNLWVAAAMRGIRAAVVPIMISAVIGMVGSAFRFPPCYAVMLLVIALYLFLNVNCVYLVVIGAVCGLLIAEFTSGRGTRSMMVLLELFISFLKIGFTSFGGLSMIPLITSEMTSHGWMTAAEVSDIVAIAEMTPGPLGLNCATFAGMRTAGFLGAIASNLGTLSPTLTVCLLASIFFERFRTSNFMTKVMT